MREWPHARWHVLECNCVVRDEHRNLQLGQRDKFINTPTAEQGMDRKGSLCEAGSQERHAHQIDRVYDRCDNCHKAARSHSSIRTILGDWALRRWGAHLLRGSVSSPPRCGLLYLGRRTRVAGATQHLRTAALNVRSDAPCLRGMLSRSKAITCHAAHR